MRSTSFFFLTLFFSVISCTKEEEVRPANEVNYAHIPTSNQLIISEAIGQQSEQNSTIYSVIDNGEGGVFFNGLNNGNEVIGSMGLDGYVYWTRTLEFDLRGIATYEYSGSVYLVAAGGRDFDGDDSFEEGRIAIYDKVGSKLDEVSIIHDDFAAWLNAVEILNDGSEIIGIAGGGAIVNGTQYPYLVRFTIDAATGNLDFDSENESSFEVFQILSDKRIVDIKASLEGSALSVYGSYNVAGEDGSAGFGVFKIEDFEASWDKPLSTNNLEEGYTDLNDCLILENGKLYFTASKRIEKTENNEDTKADWYAINAYCLSTSSGEVIWENTLNHTYRSDISDGIAINGEELYVVGVVASWIERIQDPALQLGYGFISVLNKSNGTENRFHSFGDEKYKQAFNCLYQSSGDVYLMGYTSYQHSTSDGGTFDKWIVKVRKEDL